MRHIIYEAITICQSKKKLTLLVTLIFTLMLVISEFVLFSFTENNQVTKAVDQIENNDKLYHIIDNADNISMYLNSLNNLNNLKNFYNQLSSSKEYEYYEFKIQPVIVRFVKNKLDNRALKFLPSGDKDYDFLIKNGEAFYGYDSDMEGQLYYNNVENIFVDLDYIQEIIRPEIYHGRSFEYDDMFLYDVNDTIPVLLGYNYSKTMRVGDEFAVNCYKFDFTYKVIGILDKDSSFPYGNELKSLDNYIISPFVTSLFTPKSKNELFFQGAIYLDKVNGYLKMNDGYSIESAFVHIENSLLTNGINFDMLPVNIEDNFRILLIKALILVDYKQSIIILISIPLIAIYLIISLEFCIIHANQDLFDLMNNLGYSHKHITACKVALTLFNTLPAFAVVVLINIIVNISSLFCLAVYVLTLVIATLTFIINDKRNCS